MEWKESEDIALSDLLQVAYQKKMSNVNTSFNLQECINHNMERNAKVFLGFLDSSKAFDVVFHNGLFYKLYKLGIQGKFWRCVMNLYSGMQSMVRVNGLFSKRFAIEQSVRQGGVLSPWLYLIYVNELILQLKCCGHGAHVGNLYAGSPFHADDIALVSLTKNGLQAMIDICKEYSEKWRFKINPLKSKVMVLGETAHEYKLSQNNRKWSMGTMELTETVEYKHVGIVLNKFQNTTERTKAACSTARKTLMSLVNCGVKENGITPMTACHLYKSVVLPKTLHGCELWGNLSKGDIDKLERIHRFCLKIIQHFPTRIRTNKVLSMVGMLPIESYIDKAKLLFLCRLCHLPNNTISKKMFLLRMFCYNFTSTVRHTGFMQDISRILDKYELYTYLSQYISDGSFPDKDKWKNIVNQAVSSYSERLYLGQTENDKELTLFRTLKPCMLEPSRIWVIAQCMPKWSLELYQLAYVAVCWHIRYSVKDCHSCEQYVDDGNIIVHAAFSCNFTEIARERMWDNISNRLEVTTSCFLHNLDPIDFVFIMLGAPLDILEYGITANDYVKFIHISAQFWKMCKFFEFADF